MAEPAPPIETSPNAEDIQMLEERLYNFNVRATGIADGQELALFLRDSDGKAIGGIYGWSWGETAYVRYLFVPGSLRGKGHGAQLMAAFEAEVRRRHCRQIVLETHSFQAPAFYRRLGFRITGHVEHYPKGHQYITLAKALE